jgi:DNA transformation protein
LPEAKVAGSFEDLLADLFAPLDGVSLRKMFGGIGVFKDAIMFGLVAQGVLYLRADATSEPQFAAEGVEQFLYTGMKGRTVAMQYFRLPERLYDEPDAFIAWSSVAFAVARRAAAEKTKGKKPAGKVAATSKTAAKAGVNKPRNTPSAKRKS